MTTKVTVDLSGPFFRRDPGQTIMENVRRMLEGIAEEGASTVMGALAVGESARAPLGVGLQPDRASGHVVGRVRSLTGNPWRMWAVVSINNSGLSAEQGIALMAGAAQAERETHAFRRTATALRSARALLTANLSAGIE